MNPNLGMPSGPSGLSQQQQQHNYMQQMQSQNPHMSNQVPPNSGGRPGPPMPGYGQPTTNQGMQAKMAPAPNPGMQRPQNNAPNSVQNKMNMQSLPIRTYLDQTVVPILLDGTFFHMLTFVTTSS